MTTQNDFVAEKLAMLNQTRAVALGLGLFTPSACDNEVDGPNRQCWKCKKCHPYPPDLLAPAGHLELEKALWKRGTRIDFGGNFVRIHDDTHGWEYAEAEIIDGDLARALLSAAEKMLNES